MPTRVPRDSLGASTLDSLFDGGIPRDSTLLVQGANGTGKTTLGLQFLATGLADGDEAVYIGTDQSVTALQRTVDNYDWTLDTPALTTITVTPTGDQTLTVSTPGDDTDNTGLAPSDAVATITDIVADTAPIDRVVIDTASALIAAHPDATPNATLVPLYELFADTHPATTVFTTTNNATITPLPDRVDGTLTLHTTDVAGDPTTLAQVQHFTGLEYDPRIVELQFDADGVTAAPRTRALPDAHQHHSQTSFGIPNLDTLLGGGLITGSSTILRHDGHAHLEPLLGSLIDTLHDRDYAITTIPPINLRPNRFESLLDTYNLDMRSLLDNDELYVIDFVGAWDAAESNVYGSTDDRTQLEGVLREVDELTQGRRATIAAADVLAHAYDTPDVRDLRYHQEGQLLGDDDVLLYLQNPNVVEDTVSEFFVDTATQVLETWLTDDGRQYLSLESSPTGAVGTTTLINHIDDPPYLEVQPPPHPEQYTITSDASMWDQSTED